MMRRVPDWIRAGSPMTNAVARAELQEILHSRHLEW